MRVVTTSLVEKLSLENGSKPSVNMEKSWPARRWALPSEKDVPAMRFLMSTVRHVL